jgi:hypothetical protein
VGHKGNCDYGASLGGVPSNKKNLVLAVKEGQLLSHLMVKFRSDRFNE